MQITILKSKIHRATVTEADLNYEGSISIDELLIKAANMIPYEKVDVLNINNGKRFSTYVIKAKAGSGEIKVNGAAARMVHKGDKVIIIAYISCDQESAVDYEPKILLLDDNNVVKI
jgi:aspartate 1-decarboxylase